MKDSIVYYPFSIEKLGMAYKDKDDTYRKMMLDRFCMLANDFYLDYQRMMENYKLKNGQLKKEDYRYLCGTIGDNAKTDIFIDKFNITSNVIESLKGEELGRPFPFTVIANSERINNRNERQKREAINNLVEKILGLEIEKANKTMEIELSKISPEEKEKLGAQLELDFQKRFNNLPDIKSVFRKYESVQSIEEITMNKVMKVLYNKHGIKRIKSNCFGDLLITASEFVEIYSDHEFDLAKIKRLNPVRVFYQKSPDVEFIHQADYAGYKERISIDQAIELYGEYMDINDYHELMMHGANWGITGTDQKFWSDGKNPDPWRDQRFGDHGHGYGGSGSFMDEWVDVSDEMFGSPYYGHIPNPSSGDYIGLHTTLQRRNMNRYIDKYVVYWKSKRKLGKLKFVNDYDELDFTFVDEDFNVPKEAKRVVTKRDNLTKDVVEYEWLDARNNKMSIEWIYINEVWKGIRLGRKHIIVEPLVSTYKSLLNPFEVKLPIYGLVINNANAMALSVMDAMKPWQKLYFAMMAKFQKGLTLDRGVWTYLNTAFMDKEIGVLDTMALAEDQGIVFYNPLLSAKDAQNPLMNSLKIADKIDMSNYQSIRQYIDLLDFIKNNIIEAAGMSQQRVAQSVANSTATDNYRETQSSMNITEPMFYAHDVFWEHIMQGYMEMVLNQLSSNSGVLREVLNDEERVVIDLQYVSLEDNYSLRVGNAGKQARILEKMQDLAQALIQNDKVNLAQLIKLQKTDNLSEFQHLMQEIEDQNQKRMEEMQKQQQQHEQEMMQMELKAREDEQVNQLEKEYLKGKMHYDLEQMKAVYNNQSFDAQKDYNHDGIADYMQLEQMQQKINNESRKIDLETAKAEMEKAHKQRELESKDKDLEIKREKQMLDLQDSELERINKQKIEKFKSAMKSKK